MATMDSINTGDKILTGSQKKSSRTIYILLGAVLILLLLFIGYKYFVKNNNAVGGIPQELILGSTLDSTDFNLERFSNSKEAEVAKYETSDSLSTLVSKYKTYFSQNGWNEVGNMRFGEEYQIVGENKADERINVSINPGSVGGSLDDSTNLEVVVIYQKLTY